MLHIRPLSGPYFFSIRPLSGPYIFGVRPLSGAYTFGLQPLSGLYVFGTRPLCGPHMFGTRPLFVVPSVIDWAVVNLLVAVPCRLEAVSRALIETGSITKNALGDDRHLSFLNGQRSYVLG